MGLCHYLKGNSFVFEVLWSFVLLSDWGQDQLGDVLHWIRQVVGLLCGLLWGAIPLVGGIWLLL